ncbi:MAG: TonB-dependent receptor [Pseudomonadota bacterium]|nr:TonB-dependent receptor [Pseudomonadota bacterium]
MFRKTVLVRALTVAFCVGAVSAVTMPSAMAQSNAAGNVFGQVSGGAGATVQLHDAATGVKRSVTIGQDGKFRIAALPVGNYQVDLVRGGKTESTVMVEVIVGQNVEASFASAVQTVQVSGRRVKIDVQNTDNGTIFSAKTLEKLPIATNLTAVILLAPNTTEADAAYGGASFGGGAASENSFYVNGFPITNPLSQLGSMELPFGASAQISVVTGGFGVEFGRSIGGVTSITTKSGTNTWEVGGRASTTPNQLRSKTKNVYYPMTGDPENKGTDGKLLARADNAYQTVEQFGAYVGGPIIKDKLFMFVALDESNDHRQGILSSTSTTLGTIARQGYGRAENRNSKYLAKFDWNLSDNHRLEWTSAGEKTHFVGRTYGFDLNPNNPNALAQLDGTPTAVKYNGIVTDNPGSDGAEINALRYTGNLSDDLTFTSSYGVLKSPRKISFDDVQGQPPAGTAFTSTGRVPELSPDLYTNRNKYPGNQAQSGTDEVKSFRLDLEYKLGNHTLRGGLDNNKIQSAGVGQGTSGGSTWTYRKVADKDINNPNALFANGTPALIADKGGFGNRGYYVRQSIFSSYTKAAATQSSLYLEDKFQVTKNLLVTGGVRSESYSNSDGDDRKFLEQKNQIAPRVSASWDVNGDASFKVYGSVGRYHLQLPTQVAARAASRSTLTRQDFTYTGIDPATGAPLGLNPIIPVGSPDGELGQLKNPDSVVSKTLKPNFQDEITAGFERAFNADFNFGVRGTFRKLGTTIDDNCDTRRLFDWAKHNGVPVAKTDNMSCFIFNPGEPATVYIDAQDAKGNLLIGGTGGKWATFSSADLGYGGFKAKRNYSALDFFLEHPDRNGWYSKVTYTLSRSTGNTEGQTRSDTGQQDISVTALFDYPEFARFGDGLLANDRRHAIKAYGYYDVTPKLTLGYNLLVQSGRPKTCLGTNVASESGEVDSTGYLDPIGAIYGGPGYGAEYYWCNGKPAPRGSLGREPTEKRLDLDVTYKVTKDLSLIADIYNVFNSQTNRSSNATYDGGDGGAISPTYGLPGNLQPARSVKFSIEYKHKF